MVVVRGDRVQTEEIFGTDFLKKVSGFSEIIGYTVESDGTDIKIEFNPDRPDLFSFTTLDSAIRTFFLESEIPKQESVVGDVSFYITEEALRLRPFVTSFVCRGGKIGARQRDMIDFQERIHQTIGKDRYKVSIGIHDLERLKPPFRYISKPRDKVSFIPYDGNREMTAEEILSLHEKGRQYSNLLTSDNVPIIEDSLNQVLSMPPIVNGIASRVSESTCNFFIDITGTDMKSAYGASLLLRHFFRSAGYIVEETRQTGGIPYSEIMANDNRVIKVRISETKKILGQGSLKLDDIGISLRRMGYSLPPEFDAISIPVNVPGSRLDVMGEVDIIEDIGKALGYGSVPEFRPNLDLVGSLRDDTRIKDRIREVSVGLGFQEAMTFVVTASKFSAGLGRGSGAEIMNPKSQDFNVIRDRLRLNILDLLRINKRRNLPQRIFEIGDVVIDFSQKTHLCYAITDSRAGFSSIKQYLNALLQRFGKVEPIFIPEAGAEFIPGRSGKIVINGKDFGIIGEIHPETLQKFDLANPVALFEIDIDAIK